ncbi:hypothetical protein FRC10_002010 [Ceratobasidium sp. 414]|nr:hypothetical protein FRC10_002010 [Ceratobasidium sp. 414]
MSAKVFHDDTGALDALRRFFGMAKIVRLQMIGRTGWHAVFSRLYSHLPDLEVLVLKNPQLPWEKRNKNSFNLLKQSASSTPPSPHYPRLDILYLSGDSVDLTWLQQLLATHSTVGI